MPSSKKSRTSQERNQSLRKSTTPTPSSTFILGTWLVEREKWYITVICLLMALKIFCYGASFPFFNNVDEEAHFDMIWKYAQGQWPEKGADITAPEAFDFILTYNSPEYKRRAQQFPGGVFPPPLWTVAPEIRQSHIDRIRQRNIRNYEAYSPPLYYLVAGGWLNLGHLIGLKGAGLLYWTRFLNILALVILVLLAWQAGRRFFPDDPTIRPALPLAVLFLPQDVFYTLNSDILSPVLSTLTFYYLARLANESESRWTLFLGAGLATAGALLVKLSNIPLLGAWPVAWFLASRPGGRWSWSSRLVGKMAVSAVAATLPLGAWLWRNHIHLGDLTGSRHKMEFLGWTFKSVTEIWSHPIFSLSGAAYFFHNLMASLWRGEIVWAMERLSRPAADYFYSISSLILVTVAVVGWGRSNKSETFATPARGPMILSLVIIGLAVLYLAVLSMLFDFGQCFYPSRALPFFVSGRLILCALVPFLILYLDGLRRMTTRWLPWISPLTVFIMIGLVITVVDLMTRYPVLASRYNFWHVPLGGP